MTQTAELPLPSSPHWAERRFVASICFAHFISHYYMTLLAPVFVFVREDYGVSSTELGLALTAFNVVSALLQTPVGFLVDRFNARIVLIAGLLAGAVAFAVAGLVHSFWVFIAMFALAGLGNTVYHPANYALLGRNISAERAGRVFSFHTFTGMLGNAAAPATLVSLHAILGWRGAFLFAAGLGVVSALIVFLVKEPIGSLQPGAKAATGTTQRTDEGWRLLLSVPILANLVFFVLLAITGGGLHNYLIVTLDAVHGTAVTVANAALTGLLTMSAVGVLAGGMLTGVCTRYGTITIAGLAGVAAICVLVGLIDVPALALIVLMSTLGFLTGMIFPARDMIVRSVTPPGAYGRVFGFVTSGFHLSGIISPIIFGLLLDHGLAREIFFVMAFCALLAIATVGYVSSRRAHA
ncbi:MAG: MFS transporter [Hyphomicrobiales bacterium]|nr:MFS transporter [Hyphomicrobiales bacterium]